MSINSPTIITSREQDEFTAAFLIALKELNNSARITQIASKLDEYIGLNLIHFNGELGDEWQYQMRWVKTELKKQGVINYKGVGRCCYWGVI